MARKTEGRWTIGELGARVARALALAEGYEGPADTRARAVPDGRTIRYYTTLGLIGRPAAIRGRTAFYGPRHLEQIVAIKRLQAAGKTLAEIQQEMAGITDRALAALSRVPPEALTDRLPVDDPAEPAAPAAAPAAPRREFWKERPADTAAPVQLGVTVAPGVTVLFPGSRAPDPEDLEEIRRAAAPLLRALAARGLINEERGERP